MENTQTTTAEAAVTDTDAAAVKIAIVDNYTGRRLPESEANNWHIDIDFDIEESTVTIEDRYGTGTSFRLYNGVDVALASYKWANWANVDLLVEYLESDDGQHYLREIAAGHSVKWDGSNHRGKLTEAAASALEQLNSNITDTQNLNDLVPTFWDASEWFINGLGRKGTLDLVLAYDTLDEAVDAEIHAGDPTSLLDRSDVRELFVDCLEKLEEDSEADLELRAKASRMLGRPSPNSTAADATTANNVDSGTGGDSK